MRAARRGGIGIAVTGALRHRLQQARYLSMGGWRRRRESRLRAARAVWDRTLARRH